VVRKTEPKKRPRLLLSAFDLENQLQKLSASTLGADRERWPYKPIPTGYTMLDDKIGGITNRFYTLASGARVGKSTFALQLAYNILLFEEDAHCLFISLDQPSRDVNIRLVAMAGECHTDYVQFPTAKEADKYDDKRQRGLMKVRGMRDRLTIVDESLGSIYLDDVISFIGQSRRRGDHPLIVVIDPLYKIRGNPEDGTPEEQLERLCQDVKMLCASQAVAVIGTTRLKKGAASRRPELDDLDDQPGVLYESDVIGLLYNDSLNDGETPFLEWDWGTDDVMVPIFELNLVKNKMAGFAGRIYYRFKNSYSKFKECTAAEIDNYNKMLLNLRVHDKDDPLVDDSAMQNIEYLDSK